VSNVILIGLRGSGKSTIGRALAARLQRPFIDLDDLTPLGLGCASIAEAWARHGEPAFRSAELEALKKVLHATNQVIALGGGTPMAPGAPDLLRDHRDRTGALIIYLRAPAHTLRTRLQSADNSHRPALTPGATDPLAEIDAVLARRDPLYRSLADEVLETEGMGEPAVSEAVSSIVARRGS
jgi:shikimate kinase